MFGNVTEGKQTRKALQESQQFLQTVLNTFPLFVFWKDCNSVYLGCNQNFAVSAGLSSPEAIVGKTDYDLPWGVSEAELYRADDREVIESGMAKLHLIESQKQLGFWAFIKTLPIAKRQNYSCSEPISNCCEQHA
jgi:PAS domain-containing protein